MVVAAVARMARSLRTALVNSRSHGWLINSASSRRGLHHVCSTVGVISKVNSGGEPPPWNPACRLWTVTPQGGLPSISAECKRSFAAHSAQLKSGRLGQTPGGQRSGGRQPKKGVAVAGLGYARRVIPQRRKAVATSNSDWDAADSKQQWERKRKSRHSDGADKFQSAAYSGKRLTSNGVVKPRSFQNLQSRRRELDDNDIEDSPAKRTRRVMRLHPLDQTNKRIVDDSPMDASRAQVEGRKKTAYVAEELAKDSSSSLNAQFRAIQPLPEILRHIETHLLGRRRLWEWRLGGYHTKLKAPLDDVPHGSKEGRLPIQETVFKRKLTFVAAAKVSTSLPSLNLPEIAFAGRSNVGKSSLINALTRQWGVVRASDKPGLTQSINFFTLGARLCLVDLPGYGFAYAKEETKEAWEDLIKEYVRTRKNLKRVCLLVDSKWGLKPRDEELIHIMESVQTKYQVVLTKSDMLAPLDLARRATQIHETLKHHRNLILPVVMVSSGTGAGIPHLRKVLVNLARPTTQQS